MVDGDGGSEIPWPFWAKSLVAVFRDIWTNKATCQRRGRPGIRAAASLGCNFVKLCLAAVGGGGVWSPQPPQRRWQADT